MCYTFNYMWWNTQLLSSSLIEDQWCIEDQCYGVRFWARLFQKYLCYDGINWRTWWSWTPNFLTGVLFSCIYCKSQDSFEGNKHYMFSIPRVLSLLLTKLETPGNWRVGRDQLWDHTGDSNSSILVATTFSSHFFALFTTTKPLPIKLPCGF